MSKKVLAPAVKLLTGQDFPLVGLGTYLSTDHTKFFDVIKAAVNFGYRHFDTALCYENEETVGRALKSALDESNGSLKREDLFIVTKLWNTYHSSEEASKCLDMQLKSLGLDYVDLYLIHWPTGFEEKTGKLFPSNENGDATYSDVHYLESYRAMERFYQEGKVKSIGLSNFSISQMKDVLENCTVRPAVNQVEIHPYFQNTELIEFCQQNNIVVTAYAPLGAPGRGWRQDSEPVVLEDPVLLQLATKYNKTPAQVVLRWLTQLNVVVIPKSMTESRVLENIDIFDFTLSNEDLQEIKKLEKSLRYFAWAELSNHPFYPFH